MTVKNWKLLDKLKAKNQNDLFAERISTLRWKASFKSILRSETAPECPPDSKENDLDSEITLEELENGVRPWCNVSLKNTPTSF